MCIRITINLASFLRNKLAKAGLAVLFALVTGALLVVPGNADDLVDRKDATALELQELESAISVSERKRNELAGQIEGLDKDRETINRTLIETTTKARGLENRITKAGRRLSQLRDEQAGIRGDLSGKQSLLAEVLGALQRMGAKPPPALLVTPEDALSSVRSAILLGSVVPEMRSETEILLSQLREMTSVSAEIETQRETLSTDLASLAQEEERLNLLLLEKQRLAGKAATDLAKEAARSAELAAQASSLNDLIASLETEITAVKEAAEAARAAEEARRERQQERVAAAKKFETEDAFSNSGRIAPALAFDQTRGLLPLPVSGLLVNSFGEENSFGEASSGINLETRQNARVISPADGWIVYAGAFRTYGQLLIINAGEGYHVVLAGMEEVNVSPGQFVIVGEPLGKMGASRLAGIGQVDVSTTKPILYVEFRKDDKSIDPAPWWADKNLERDANGS